MRQQKILTLKTLTKNNVWDIQENDVFRMLEAAEKDADLKSNMRHYASIIRSAFEIEEIKIDRPEIIAKYDARGFKIGQIRLDDTTKMKWAIKKRSIMRITDLTYENIRHISAGKLIEVLERNFGGGWDSLSQNVQDIITSGFDISTTTLPQDRLHNPGGMYEKKVDDGFEVLEIPKGTWVEAIFVKEKPEFERPRVKFEPVKEERNSEKTENEAEIEEKTNQIVDNDGEDEDDDTFDDEKLTEESYRTTFDTTPEDLNLEATEVSEESDY